MNITILKTALELLKLFFELLSKLAPASPLWRGRADARDSSAPRA